MSEPSSVESGATARNGARAWAWIGSLLPQRSDYAGLRRSWPRDLLAGVTVAVVALPLALGFGVASGMGAAAGLVTAVVAGIVAAIFGGSNYQVSGPTGAMTVVLIPIVSMYGVQAVVATAVLAGVVLVAMGVFGLGRLVSLIPWPVIEGFTVGIAIIIALQQVPNALGVQVEPSGNTVLTAAHAVAEVSPASWPALAITVLTMVIMVAVPRIRKTLPSSLIAVIIATVVAVAFGLSVSTVGAIPNRIPGLAMPEFSSAVIHGLLGSAAAVAALAAIESLLSARVADGMADAPPSNPDRELVGQGLANVASGLVGGMPATGAIARTAVNVRAGASTRFAAIAHSLVLLAIMLFAARLVSWIPLATLAGVLIMTAWRMVDLATVRSILHSTKPDSLVFVLTAACTVAFDLVVAVEIGIVVAAVLALFALARTSGTNYEELPDLSDHVETSQEHDLLRRHIAVYRVDGAMFFGAAQRFLHELTSISDVQVIILRMSGVKMIDATGAQTLGAAVKALKSEGITVIFKGLKPEHEQLLVSLGAINPPGPHHHSFETLPGAIEHAGSHIRSANDFNVS